MGDVLMYGSLLLAAAVATLGSDYGWQPLAGGGVEYIIQIDPHIVDRLKEGIDITSDVPAEVKDIRSCRFTVGSGELPRINPGPVMPEPDEGLPSFASPDRPRRSEVPLDTRPDGVPGRLPERGGSEDGVKPVGWLEETEPKLVSPETVEPNPMPEENQPEAPSSWLLATLAIGLMSTSAGMVFTGWTAWDYRGRYRRVLEKLTVEERMRLETAAG